MTNNLTVPNGVTLQLNPGVTINSSGSYKLRIQGRLIAVGNSNNRITFTRSGGQWYGIEFYYNPLGYGDIQYANIQNAQYGVSSYGTYTYITNTSFTNNYIGMYLFGSINSANWCLFEYNTYGVRCENYGDGNIQTNNRIRFNSWGVSGDYSSAFTVGSYIGYNSIYYNDYYDVYSDYGGTIPAHGNWWGQYPAYPSVTMNVDYSGELSGDPNGSFLASPDRPVASRALLKVTSSADTAGMKELDEAYRLYLDADFEIALNKFESLVDHYGNRFSGARALVFADRIREKLGQDAKAALGQVIMSDSKVRTTAKSLLVGHLIREGSNEEALNLASELIDNTDPLIAKAALFNAGNIAWYVLGDESKGREYFDKLIAQYPNAPESHSAQATMGIWEPQFVERGTVLENEEETTPFSLQSYPNPFNPATEIRFSIPEDGLVTLRIYDVLGRVIATLVNEVRQAGPYRVHWNAANVPSGVYFSRLETRGGALVSKLLLVR